MRKQYYSRRINGKNYIWDVDRLVELSKDFKPKDVPLTSIKELDENFWFGAENDIPTCRAIADHAGLIQETELQYPIILSSDGRVMDGMHRVAKAYLEDRETIKAVQFEEDPEADYIDVDLDELPY